MKPLEVLNLKDKYDILVSTHSPLPIEIQNNIDLNQSNSSLVREQVISEVSEDLADTEFEKFKSLTQDVDFGDDGVCAITTTGALNCWGILQNGGSNENTPTQITGLDGSSDDKTEVFCFQKPKSFSVAYQLSNLIELPTF